MLNVLHPKLALLAAMLTFTSMQAIASDKKESLSHDESKTNASTSTYLLTKGKIQVTNLLCHDAKTGSISLTMEEPGWTAVLSGSKGIIMSGKDNVVFDNLQSGEYLISMTGPLEGETQQIAVQITAPPKEKLTIGQITPYDCEALASGSLEINATGVQFYECHILNSMGNEVHQGIITESYFTLDQLKGDVYYVEYETGCSSGQLEADLRDEKQVNARISSDQIHVESLTEESIRVSIKPDLINATHCTWQLDDGTKHEGDDYTAIFTGYENHTLLFTAENESCKYTEVLSLHASDLPELSAITPMPYASAFIENNQLRISLRQLQYAATDIKIMSSDGQVLWSQSIKDSQKSDSEINLSAFTASDFSVIVTNHGMPILSREFHI